MPTYSLKLDPNGNIIGSHYYGDNNATLEPNEVLCTPEQALNPSTVSIVNGVIVDNFSGIQGSKVASLSQSCQAAIINGFSSNADGTLRSYTLSQIDQNNGLMAAITANGAIQRAITWSASTTIAANQTILENGNYYICVKGGISGTTLPSTWPTAFSTPLTDGSVVWELFGLLTGTTLGNIRLTAQQIITVYEGGVNWVDSQRSHYTKQKNVVMAYGTEPLHSVGTVTALGAVIQVTDSNYTIWRFTCTTPGTTSTTAPHFNFTSGATTLDGNVVWTCQDTLINLVNAVIW